jgi:hypothetical protein
MSKMVKRLPLADARAQQAHAAAVEVDLLQFDLLPAQRRAQLGKRCQACHGGAPQKPALSAPCDRRRPYPVRVSAGYPFG